MKHYGDITKLSGYTLPIVDCITGGSPCQDLSIAGLRAGLEGQRSGLFMEQVRIVKEMREHDRNNGRTGDLVRPRYLVWENVVGAYSSNKGKDFQAVLTEIIRIAEPTAPDVPLPNKGKWPKQGLLYDELGRWSVAYRTVDAQYWGTPQRRKRIALVADFGGCTAGSILFEQESLHRDTEESGAEREETARATGASVENTVDGIEDVYCAGFDGSMGSNAGNIGYEEERSITAKQTGGGHCVCIPLEGNGSRESHHGDGYGKAGDPMFTLNTVENHAICAEPVGWYQNGRGECFLDAEKAKTIQTNSNPSGRGVQMLLEPVAYRKQAHPRDSTEGQGYEETEVNDTLNIFDNSESRTPTVVVEPTAYGFEPGVAQRLDPESRVNEELSPTIRANMGDNQVAVAYGICSYDSNAMKSSNPNSGFYVAETSRTLDLNGGNPTCNQGGVAVVYENNATDARYTELGETCCTLKARLGTGGNNQPLVLGVDAYNQSTTGEVSKTLNSIKSDSDHTPCVLCLNDQGGSVMNTTEECSGTLRAEEHGHQPAVMAYGLDRASYNQGVNAKLDFSVEQEKIDPQMARGPGAVCTCETYQNVCGTVDTGLAHTSGDQIASNDMLITGKTLVRRLTPIECERLQGYPDNFTNIGSWVDTKGKLHKESSDSARYKALGNSIAVGYANNGSGFWMWLMKRISAQYTRNATLGSLFDGIGGFPLAWEHYNGKGSAIWASEIEEFCIAVTKVRFPDEESEGLPSMRNETP